jgi:hypothetical protein
MLTPGFFITFAVLSTQLHASVQHRGDVGGMSVPGGGGYRPVPKSSTKAVTTYIITPENLRLLVEGASDSRTTLFALGGLLRTFFGATHFESVDLLTTNNATEWERLLRQIAGTTERLFLEKGSEILATPIPPRREVNKRVSAILDWDDVIGNQGPNILLQMDWSIDTVDQIFAAIEPASNSAILKMIFERLLGYTRKLSSKVRWLVEAVQCSPRLSLRNDIGEGIPALIRTLSSGFIDVGSQWPLQKLVLETPSIADTLGRIDDDELVMKFVPVNLEDRVMRILRSDVQLKGLKKYLVAPLTHEAFAQLKNRLPIFERIGDDLRLDMNPPEQKALINELESENLNEDIKTTALVVLISYLKQTIESWKADLRAHMTEEVPTITVNPYLSEEFDLEVDSVPRRVQFLL